METKWSKSQLLSILRSILSTVFNLIEILSISESSSVCHGPSHDFILGKTAYYLNCINFNFNKLFMIFFSILSSFKTTKIYNLLKQILRWHFKVWKKKIIFCFQLLIQRKKKRAKNNSIQIFFNNLIFSHHKQNHSKRNRIRKSFIFLLFQILFFLWWISNAYRCFWII
jgi:hypothetical protein